MRLAWLTDVHLNFLDKNSRKQFYADILQETPDAILLTGDIAEAPSLYEIFTEMANDIQKDIYFILGNHDYYFGEVEQVRENMRTLVSSEKWLHWLPASGIQVLTSDTVLVGQDGWADGRLGDYSNSNVSLNDSRLITDLFHAKIVGKFQLLDKMQQLADADAMQLKSDLLKAINSKVKKIIILTHVPPFRETCWHEGKISDDDWLPFFSSKITGDVLMQVAQKNAEIQFLALCGHTHSEAHYQPLDNLTVEVGQAEYYWPKVQKVIEVWN